MNVKSIKNWVKEKWNNSVNWILKNQVKSLVIGLLISLLILLVANLSGDRCWPPIPFIENLGKTETSKFCNPGVLIVRLGYAIYGVIALLFIEVYFGIKVFINWVKENPKPIVIFILLLLVVILLYNLFPGTTCWPGKLGIPETSQSCKNIKCCHSGTLILRLGYAIGGVIALLAVVIASERAKASDKAADAQIITAKAQNETAKAQIKTVKVQEKRNIEERYKNAISQLEKENPNVRLEGAYELYYLAKDSKYRFKYICDRLCRHIRDLTTNKIVVSKTTDGKEIIYSEKYKTKPSDEVQSILDLLTNKDNKEDFPFKSDWINLKNAYLNGADLNSAQLQGANLRQAWLQGANLDGAQLQGANLKRVQLQGADLTTAQLQGAVLIQAQLQWATLGSSKLQKAYLIDAQFQWAKLGNAQLQGAVLIQTQLQGANLWKAQLQGAYLSSAQLQGAVLEKAQLQGAFLMSSHFQGANLEKAYFQGANLSDAQLQGANLDKTDFRGAFTKKNTSSSGIVRLISRKNQKDEIENAIFSGGVTQKQLDDFKKITAETLGNLNKIKNYNQNKINDFIQEVDKVKKILEDNIDKPIDTSIPSEATTGVYPEAEAIEVITMLDGVEKELKKQYNPLKIHDFLIE